MAGWSFLLHLPPPDECFEFAKWHSGTDGTGGAQRGERTVEEEEEEERFVHKTHVGIKAARSQMMLFFCFKSDK